jgi:hypothetical protein
MNGVTCSRAIVTPGRYGQLRAPVLLEGFERAHRGPTTGPSGSRSRASSAWSSPITRAKSVDELALLGDQADVDALAT